MKCSFKRTVNVLLVTTLVTASSFGAILSTATIAHADDVVRERIPHRQAVRRSDELPDSREAHREAARREAARREAARREVVRRRPPDPVGARSRE